MSGGSFSYLCYKEVPDLFSGSTLQDMQEMEEYLLANGYQDIAQDVRRLIEYIKSAQNRIGILHGQLENVFHAVEWCVSGDYGDDTMRKVLEEYRKGPGNGKG